ncbi:hypothetical protein FSP39_001596 [Pinctada imbricata]|uniref:Rab3 GTPase-activating protein non-catalytic subunit n=1 Tax=Pinctada imbricata TaxID=66713 RepID=A0AA88XUL2_PINIB|nr:hypothetical protein FSP39_001596 [Pinctada imbricata]
MSCQMNVFAYVAETSKIKKFLFPESTEPAPQIEEEDDGWDEDWGAWNEDMKEEDAKDVTENDFSPDTNNSWLQQCILSLSPANDIMAVANQDRCVLLSQKFQKNGSNSEVDTNLTVNWEGSLSQTDGEVITALMCLPLASQKRSTQGAPDWTCVIVGFSTGYVRIYTESGALLLSQLLHTEPVQKLKCRTYEPHRYLGLAEQQEEVVIMYQRVLVTIDGFSLVQSLRACRNQVARATASGSENFFQPPPLAYKKWGLQDQEKIYDFCSCGVDTPNPFDNMKAASMSGNPQTALRHTPPAAGLYMTTGIGQYVGFYYTIEGSTQPILSEVAYAVANKLKSAFVSATSGWLGFGGKHKDEAKHGPKIEPATPLSIRFGLPDKSRHGVSVYLSPSDNYAATTDSFGRVVLIDVQRGVAIRMWKGYRDAQLGWVQVKELSNHGGSQGDNQTRTAQFLVIYAPRRGILEVWTAGLGPRVAAFNVSKSCTLICPSYGIMGLNNVTVRGINTRAFQCALMDTDGTLKTLHIPFHLALSDKNDKRARDLHLLRTLKAHIKDNSQQTGYSMKRYVNFQIFPLQNLLLDYWLSSDDRGIHSVASLSYLIKGLLSKIGEETKHTWMLSAQQLCRQTTCVLPAYLLALTLRSIITESEGSISSEKKSVDEGENKKGVSVQGNPPQDDIDSWGLLVRQLEDTLCINCLLHLPTDTGQITQVSVHKILEAGRVAEIVGSELAKRKISVNELFKSNIQNSKEASEVSVGQPTLLGNLEFSLEYLKLIQNAVLRHGVASMMWQMFVTERFASLAQLMEKVGKVPKDRLCRKEVGVEEADLSRLTGCMVDLLQALMEANCEVNEVPVFNIEPTWQSVRGPHSLVDLAIEAKMTNYGLIRHHYHLSVLMNAVAVFKMKSVKILSLFDSKGRHAFFTEFTQHPLLPSPNVDDSICYGRSEFLGQVISHAVQTLDSGTGSFERTLSDGQSTSAFSSPVKRKSTMAVRWPNVVLDIAKDFGLDIDIFKRHHVWELYSSGHDKAAEEILITVNDHEAVGSQLLHIAGKRINHYLLISNKMEGVDLLTNISPSLSLWIRSQDPSNLRKPESTTQSLAMLLQHVLSNLPEGYTEYNTALELVDLVQSMTK